MVKSFGRELRMWFSAVFLCNMRVGMLFLSGQYSLIHSHDVVLVGREQHAPQSLVLAVVNVRPFGVVAHLRVHAI